MIPPTALIDRLRSEIRAQGPVSFARFMELALYDPDHGYYSGQRPRLGADGDFVTASDAGRDFGRCLARQLIEIDRLLGPLQPFDLLEFGAGRGLLARDAIDAARELSPSLAGRLRTTLVDRSPRMREVARGHVPEARVIGSSAELETTGRREGAAVAVELFDALPVRRVRRRDGELVEVQVGLDEDGELCEREAEVDDELATWSRRYDVAAEEGQQAEIAPSLPIELERLAASLDRGVLLIVDYGDDASGLYGPRRPDGTLLAYHRHSESERWFDNLGRQDLTAHVNFTALEDAARGIGLEVLGHTTQDRFLISNGILERFEVRDATQARRPRQVKQRLQAMQLIHPQAMGRRFRVLALSKGCRPRLRGLEDPFARGRA